MNLKVIARRALRRAGVARIHHPSFADIMKHERIQTVLDVGANDGHFGCEIREQGFQGQIVSFEPIPSVFADLQRRSSSDPKWDAYCLGVGETECELPISVTKSTVFSSFKAASAYTADKFLGAQVERQELVPVVRLDGFLTQHPEYAASAYLKIDTQGFEKEVMVGAGDMLQKFKGIQLEVAVRALYDDQDTVADMIRWMDDRGFIMGLAKENGYDWDSMRLLELDLLFLPRW
jgi:FkbM family methyltransferase